MVVVLAEELTLVKFYTAAIRVVYRTVKQSEPWSSRALVLQGPGLPEPGSSRAWVRVLVDHLWQVLQINSVKILFLI